ncbi:MAG: AAA family ATPase, partial [Calditrichaeota bacterium]|nr:AAA family ATPase [Calditrichota bacterium]
MMIDSGKIESPALRLARYLKEFVGLRSTTVRDFSKYESVIWFNEMPQVADCRSAAWTDALESDESWLEVRKQEFRNPPAPPAAIAQWVDETALARATQVFPPLREFILVEDTNAELEDGESPPMVKVFLKDHPEAERGYEQYRPKWEAWSEDHRRREAVQRIYAKLFTLHTQLQKQGEILELVLGMGLLDWRAPGGNSAIAVRRHVVVGNVELTFEPGKGIIRIGPPGEGARLRIEDDMLEAELRPDRSHYTELETQLEEIGDAVWDKPLVYEALRSWAGVLEANAHWHEGLDAREGNGKYPCVSFAPALILRKRLQTGMVRVYEKLIEDLGEENSSVPDGWGILIDDKWESKPPSIPKPVDELTGITPSDSEIYFPLPANREQRQIVRALESDRHVLVQGPPGTGKSHTIANLMCHLLATGKRVLITAETARALKVL